MGRKIMGYVGIKIFIVLSFLVTLTAFGYWVRDKVKEYLFEERDES